MSATIPRPTAAQSPVVLRPPLEAPSDDAPAARACKNCGHAADENFCPNCGQETHDLHRSLGGILGEVLDAFAGWDAKIPMSIGLLITRPGALTVEFLSGRRVRYLRPLRLYLTMSVLFFLSVSLVPNSREQRGFVTNGDGTTLGIIQVKGGPSDRVDVRTSDSAMTAFVKRNAGEAGPGFVPWFKHRFKEGMRNVMRLPPEQRAHAMQAAFFSRIGNVVFVLMPIFALILRMLYRRLPLYYAEHVVFALHSHAFAMCGLTVTRVIGSLAPAPLVWIALVTQLWIPVHLYLSMRRVYGQSRGRTIGKFVALCALYGPILLGATGVTALYAIMQMGA